MKPLEESYRRSIGEELAFICRRLAVDEVEILGKAMRRGVFEIYKAAVLHEMEAGRLDPEEAARLLGSRVVERTLAERRATSARQSQRPGPRKMPRRRKK